MHLYLRRSLATAFFLLFFIGFLPLIFITAGQLYNPKKGEFEKTTLLIVESTPENATILLNKRVPQNWWSTYIPLLNKKNYTTPQRLNYLIPDTYDVSVHLDGYYEWSNTISLKPGESTFLTDIKLWPNRAPEPVLPTSVSLITLSPTFARVAYVHDENNVIIADSETGANDRSFPQEHTVTALHWSPRGTHLLIVQGSSAFSIDLLSGERTHIPFNATADAFWSGATIYFESTKGIQGFNTATQAVVNITGGAIDWDTHDDSLWILTASTLMEYDATGTRKATITPPENQTLKEIIFQDGSWVYVLSADEALFRFHKSSETWQSLDIRRLRGIDVTTSQNTALWWSEFEIGTLFLDTKKSTIHTRLSTPLHSVIVDGTDTQNYYLAVTRDALFALTATFGDGFRTQELFSLPGITKGVFSEKEQTVLLITEDDNGEQRLWRYPTSLE